MNPIYFWKQISFSNPLFPVARCFSETIYAPWVDENGKKHVQIIKGLWKELLNHNTFVYEEVDNQTYSCEVANKLYQIDKATKFTTQKMPKEIADALARDPFFPQASNG